MYQILIIQQNEKKSKTIQRIIETNFHEVIIVSAFSGTEALRIIRERNIKIVFLAIELVDVSGIDVADELMKEEEHPYIVFTSLYDYFEFARKAIQLGVSDYLLEPISEHDIIEVMERLLSQVEKDKVEKEEKKQNTQLIKDLTELSGYSFLYSILFDGRTTKETDDFKRILGLSPYGYWINVEFENRMYNIGVDVDGVTNCIKQVLGEEIKYIPGPKIQNRFLLFVSDFSHESGLNNGTTTGKKIAKRILEKLEMEYKNTIRLGIGSVQKVEKMNISYEESIRCLRMTKNQNIVHICDVDESDLAKQRDFTEMERKMVESMELGKEDVMETFTTILSLYRMLPEEERRNKILEQIVLVCHATAKLGPGECDFTDYSRIYEEFSNIETMELDAWALNKFQHIIRSARKNAIDHVSEIVKTAIYYIYEHYSENISLNDVAGMVGVSLQYFSKIFKDETGYNFVEWVNKLRISKAKELMSGTQLTIKEVCFKVGYNDPNYFSRIFKKYEGIAPTEFAGKKD